MMPIQVQSSCRRDRRTVRFNRSTTLIAAIVLASLVSGCAASKAFNRGNDAAQAGEWDLAIEQYRVALQKDPDNPEYRAVFQRAMYNASVYYADQGRLAEARGQTENALKAYRRAAEFDPSNRALAQKTLELERRLRDQAQAAQPRPNIDQLRDAARRTGPPTLVRFNEVLPAIEFNNASVRDILAFIGMTAGINVTFERDYQERAGAPGQQGYSVQLDGVTLEQALNQVVSANELFYKVLDPKTIMVINDTQAKRLAHEDQVIKALRVSHADATDLVTMIQQLVRIPGAAQANFQVFANKTQNSITLRAPASVAAIIERLVEISDTPKAEIVVDVEILEVNRRRIKQYGLDLGNYTIGMVYSPETDPRAPDGSLTSPAFNADALAGGISRSDFWLTVPPAAIRFLENDQQTKLLAKPQLRGAEGDKLVLNLGDEIPVPTTVFTPLAQGGANFNPLSSFEYRPVGIILEITPRVTYEDEVILELIVENSTLGSDINISGSNLPTFSTRRVEAKLRLRDGESNLLAGLIRESDRRSLRGFPGILRLPVIKQLFSANDQNIEETDIIMLLTPRIIRTKEITQADVDALFIGTARNLGLGGPAPLIAPAAEPAAPAPAQPPPPAPGVNPGAIAPTPPPVTAAAAGATPPRDTPPAPAALSAPPGPAASAGGGAGQVVLTPPTAEFKVGSNALTMPINITNASRMSSVTLTVTYNPTALRVRSVQQGSFMSTAGSAVAFTEDHATPGRVDIVIMRTADNTGAAGTGMLAALLFDAIGTGPANLSITGSASAPGGIAIPVQFAPVNTVVVK
jgi:type II secretory pathway component GspD/PulD (secretin)